jgi:rubrerythrin
MKHTNKAWMLTALVMLLASTAVFADVSAYGATAAAQAGVDAEIANIAMYKTFLSRPELSDPVNASVKTLFEQLMRASENHLRAFRNQLARY